MKTIKFRGDLSDNSSKGSTGHYHAFLGKKLQKPQTLLMHWLKRATCYLKIFAIDDIRHWHILNMRRRCLPRCMHFWQVSFYFCEGTTFVKALFSNFNFRLLPNAVHHCRIWHSCRSSPSSLAIRNDIWTNRNTQRLSPGKHNSNCLMSIFSFMGVVHMIG